MKCTAQITVLLVAMVASFALADDAAPKISEQAIKLATDAIKGYEGVRDASVSQDDDQLTLVLVVGAATNEEHARELCENFVRLVKVFGPDEAPKKDIGTGVYDYLVGAFTPQEEQLALGAKTSTAKSITWRD